MTLLRQEFDATQSDAVLPPEHTIQDLDPIALLEIQAMFGELLTESPRLTQFVNALGPCLFATLLFTASQEYEISDDGESVTPKSSNLEAENAAIGLIKSVTAAFNKLDGEVGVDPTDQEIEDDTEISPIN